MGGLQSTAPSHTATAATASQQRQQGTQPFGLCYINAGMYNVHTCIVVHVLVQCIYAICIHEQQVLHEW